MKFQASLLISLLFTLLTSCSVNREESVKSTVEIENPVQAKTDSRALTLIAKNYEKLDTSRYNNYENGEKHGLWRTYYKNGQLKRECNYSNGKKEGLCKEWWKNGKLWTAEIYAHDKANGLARWYSEKGHLAGKGNMKDGKRTGYWRICDVHNAVSCIDANFKADKKDGLWKIYYDDGKLWKEQIWKEDKMIDEKCWNEEGNKMECP